MPRLLKESEAWREIAEQVERRGLGASGLCFEVGALREADRISRDVRLDMYRSVREHMSLYAFTFDTPGYAPTRILAALFLSYEAADEGK